MLKKPKAWEGNGVCFHHSSTLGELKQLHKKNPEAFWSSVDEGWEGSEVGKNKRPTSLWKCVPSPLWAREWEQMQDGCLFLGAGFLRPWAAEGAVVQALLSMACESGVRTNRDNDLAMSIKNPGMFTSFYLSPSLGRWASGTIEPSRVTCSLRSCVLSKITVQGSRKGIWTTFIST